MTGSEDRHENRLSLRAAHRSIPKVILPHNYRKTDLSLGMVIISCNIGMKQEGQEFVAILGETLRESFRVRVSVSDPEDVRQAYVQIGDLAFIDFFAEPFAVDHELKRFTDQPLEPSSKSLPLGRVVAQGHLLDLPQQMHDTLLLGERLDAVIGAEEVRDQDPVEYFAEHLLDYRAGPGWRKDVIGQASAGEAPQPGRAAQYPPAALVDVQDGGELRRFRQVVVHGLENRRQALPLQNQTARSDRELAKGAQPGADIARRHAQGVVQEGGKQCKAHAQRRSRQCIGHRRRYFPSARGAVVFVDDMFGHRGLRRRDVFDNPDMFAARLSYRALTVGTFAQLVLHGPIDVDRSGPPGTGMPVLTAGLAATFTRGRLAVNRPHGRKRRQRCWARRRLRHGLEVSLEPCVLLLQLCDSLLVSGALSFAFLLLPSEPLVFALQAVDLTLLPLEKSGRATKESLTKRQIPC